MCKPVHMLIGKLESSTTFVLEQCSYLYTSFFVYHVYSLWRTIINSCCIRVMPSVVQSTLNSMRKSSLVKRVQRSLSSVKNWLNYHVKQTAIFLWTTLQTVQTWDNGCQLIVFMWLFRFMEAHPEMDFSKAKFSGWFFCAYSLEHRVLNRCKHFTIPCVVLLTEDEFCRWLRCVCVCFLMWSLISDVCYKSALLQCWMW